MIRFTILHDVYIAIIFTRVQFTNTSFNNLRSDSTFFKNNNVMIHYVTKRAQLIHTSWNLYIERYFSTTKNSEISTDPFASPIELEIV